MEKIVEELNRFECELRSKLDKLTDQARETSEKLTQIRTAINALNGKTRLPLKTTARKDNKPTEAGEVARLLMEQLKDSGPMPKDKLFQFLQNRMLAIGRPKFGLKSKLTKAISTSKFEKTADGQIQLARQSNSKSQSVLNPSTIAPQ